MARTIAKFRSIAAEAGRDIPISIFAFGDPTPETLHHYRELGVVRTIVGISRTGWDDPGTTMPFIDRYAALIPELA